MKDGDGAAPHARGHHSSGPALQVICLVSGAFDIAEIPILYWYTITTGKQTIISRKVLRMLKCVDDALPSYLLI